MIVRLSCGFQQSDICERKQDRRCLTCNVGKCECVLRWRGQKHNSQNIGPSHEGPCLLNLRSDCFIEGVLN